MAISYMNSTNEPCDAASHQMMECLVEVLTERGASRYPLQITVLTETKEKYRSLSNIFQHMIEMDIKDGTIVAD